VGHPRHPSIYGSMGSMAFLNQGIYPDRLKFAIVRLINKKGEKTDVANYRPTSLITTLAEILEKLVYSRLSQHLNVNKSLTLEQFGFEKTVILTQQFIH